jgi:hypothetical protein
MATPAELRAKEKKAKELERKKLKEARRLARGDSPTEESNSSFGDKFRSFFRNDSTDKAAARKAVDARKRGIKPNNNNNNNNNAGTLKDLNFAGPEQVLGKRKVDTKPVVAKPVAKPVVAKPVAKPVVAKPVAKPVAEAPKTFKDFSGAGALKRAKAAGVSSYLGSDGKEKAAVSKEDLKEGQSLREYLNEQRLAKRTTKKSGQAGMMNGGKVKKYKTGSTVRGHGIARGGKACKMR